MTSFRVRISSYIRLHRFKFYRTHVFFVTDFDIIVSTVILKKKERQKKKTLKMRTSLDTKF